MTSQRCVPEDIPNAMRRPNPAEEMRRSWVNAVSDDVQQFMDGNEHDGRDQQEQKPSDRQVIGRVRQRPAGNGETRDHSGRRLDYG